MEIEQLDLEVKTYNRLKKAGISTTDDLVKALYSKEMKVSAPDAKKCEAALKDAGIIKYMRGDYVTEDDIEPEPLTWDKLHDYIGKLVVFDCSTESHKWLKVNWIYDMQDDGEGTVICSDGSRDYSYIRRSQVNGDYSRDPEFLKGRECLKYEGRFFALKSEREGATAMIAPQMKTPPADIKSAVTDKYTEAYNLNVRICVNAQMAQQNLYEVCKGLKEMRDGKLYKELGYSNFEDYCENEVGLSRFMAYKYAAIADMKNVESIQQIGVTKLALLAKLDEPQREEIQQTTDLENTSVKELKAKIDDLKKANDRLMGKVDEAEKKAENSRKSEESACGKLSILRTDAEMKQTRIEQLESRNAALEEQVLELESRPVDVAVQTNDEEINRLTAQFQEELKKQKHYAEKELERKLEEQRQSHKKDLENQRKMLNEENVEVEHEIEEKAMLECHIKFATDSLRRLVKWLLTFDSDDSAYTHYAVKKVNEVLGILNEKEKK